MANYSTLKTFQKHLGTLRNLELKHLASTLGDLRLKCLDLRCIGSSLRCAEFSQSLINTFKSLAVAVIWSKPIVSATIACGVRPRTIRNQAPPAEK